MPQQDKSGGGPPQSKTCRKFGTGRQSRSVLECASPLALSAKLKAPNTKEEKFEDVVKSAQDAAVLVLVY